jgi:hypothetical protein
VVELHHLCKGRLCFEMADSGNAIQNLEYEDTRLCTLLLLPGGTLTQYPKLG